MLKPRNSNPNRNLIFALPFRFSTTRPGTEVCCETHRDAQQWTGLTFGDALVSCRVTTTWSVPSTGLHPHHLRRGSILVRTSESLLGPMRDPVGQTLGEGGSPRRQPSARASHHEPALRSDATYGPGRFLSCAVVYKGGCIIWIRPIEALARLRTGPRLASSM